MIRLECIVRIAVGSEGNLCRSMQELKGERSKMFDDRCEKCKTKLFIDNDHYFICPKCDKDYFEDDL